MKKKKILTLEAEPYEKLREITKSLGWPKYWLSHEVDRLVAGLLVVAEQARKDADELKDMTEGEARKRYEDLMRRVLDQS